MKKGMQTENYPQQICFEHYLVKMNGEIHHFTHTHKKSNTTSFFLTTFLHIRKLQKFNNGMALCLK